MPDPTDLRLSPLPDGPDDKPSAPTSPNPVDQCLGMEARTLIRGVPLPADGPLTETQRAAVTAAVRLHLKEHALTRIELGTKIGYSGQVIGQVLCDTYTSGNIDKILRKLNTWIEDDEVRRRKARPIGFYSTGVFQAIRMLAKYARSNSRVARPGQTVTHAAQEAARIVLGYGPAGCGKSVGAAALHAEDPFSILVRVDQRRGTDLGLARLIVNAAQFRKSSSKIHLIEFIYERLRDSNRLLIVDEAHRLKFSGCELIRDLADVCGIPVLLLGTAEVHHRLTSVRVRSGNYLYDQFSRRVGLQLNLLRGVDGLGGVTRPIYSIEEIRGIFRSDEVRLTPDAERYLQDVACCIGLGMLGLAQGIFENAYRVALKRQTVIDEPLLRSAAQRALIPAGEADPEVLQRIESTAETNRRLAAASG
ncbi:MAG: AAA family ATPase [Phycisphaerae bacterium]